MPIRSIFRAARARFWDSGRMYPIGPAGPQVPLYPDIDPLGPAPWDCAPVDPRPGTTERRANFGKRTTPPVTMPERVPLTEVMRLCSADDLAIIEAAHAIRARGGTPAVVDWDLV